YHTPLFPDSILDNEERDKSFLVRDIAYTNSIHKIYFYQ
ncbi:N-acetyltransferase, partial [Bacteroides xylanisolvens]